MTETAREALVAEMRTAYRDNKILGITTGTDTPARIAMYVTDALLVVLADAIIAAGWRPADRTSVGGFQHTNNMYDDMMRAKAVIDATPTNWAAAE